MFYKFEVGLCNSSVNELTEITWEIREVIVVVGSGN